MDIFDGPCFFYSDLALDRLPLFPFFSLAVLHALYLRCTHFDLKMPLIWGCHKMDALYTLRRLHSLFFESFHLFLRARNIALTDVLLTVHIALSHLNGDGSSRLIAFFPIALILIDRFF